MCAALGLLATVPPVRAQSTDRAEPPARVIEDEDTALPVPAMPVSTGNRYYDQLLNARAEPPPAAASAASPAGASLPAATAASRGEGPATADADAAAPASLRDALLREGADFAQQQREAQAAREAATAATATAGGPGVQAAAWAGATREAEGEDRIDLRAMLLALQAHRYEVLAGVLVLLLVALGLSARHNRRQRRRAREAARRTVGWPGAPAVRGSRPRRGRR